MKILAIDTSSQIASVAICDENKTYHETTIETNMTHSQMIMPMVEKALAECEFSLKDIDAFAVDSGPGSYTGLRIGVAAIKGMAFAEGKPCFGISTLHSLAYNCNFFNGEIVSIIHARQEVVYFARFFCENGVISYLEQDKMTTVNELIDVLAEISNDVLLVGDYALNIFASVQENEKFSHVHLSPIMLRTQLATSLCKAAFNEEKAIAPKDLEVNYLQLTKAEKDLNLKG